MCSIVTLEELLEIKGGSDAHPLAYTLHGYLVLDLALEGISQELHGLHTEVIPESKGIILRPLVLWTHTYSILETLLQGEYGPNELSYVEFTITVVVVTLHPQE